MIQNQNNPPTPFNLDDQAPFGIGQMMTLKLMHKRMGNYEKPKYYPNSGEINNVNTLNQHLQIRGGYPQQERMIRDKRKSFDHATLYSYQGAIIKKVDFEGDNKYIPARALITPDKNKMDYDDKIVSVGYEHNFQAGDVFEWLRTNTFWLIYLQDLDELAYFRGEIRRCDYIINWLDEDGKVQKTYAAIRGPVETKINYIEKHQLSVDTPNHSLHILIPKNEATVKYFTRYSKFYLKDNIYAPDNQICWRVEATDSISTKGILEITAVEYYANETEDDVEKGLVGAYIEKKIEPELDPVLDIIGPQFIKPKITYEYYVEAQNILGADWYIDGPKVPVKLEKFTTEAGHPAVKLTWCNGYSGSFTLWYGEPTGHIRNYSKTIVVESLF